MLEQVEKAVKKYADSVSDIERYSQAIKNHDSQVHNRQQCSFCFERSRWVHYILGRQFHLTHQFGAVVARHGLLHWTPSKDAMKEAARATAMSDLDRQSFIEQYRNKE